MKIIGVFAVYPRWRGEHEVRISGIIPEDGLSPLARGTRRQYAPWMNNPRFIPAGAGNTRDKLEITDEFTVYPRWRGEHDGLSFFGEHVLGLSPLARGTRSAGRWPVFRFRFIPAGAGNTRHP